MSKCEAAMSVASPCERLWEGVAWVRPTLGGGSTRSAARGQAVYLVQLYCLITLAAGETGWLDCGESHFEWPTAAPACGCTHRLPELRHNANLASGSACQPHALPEPLRALRAQC